MALVDMVTIGAAGLVGTVLGAAYCALLERWFPVTEGDRGPGSPAGTSRRLPQDFGFLKPAKPIER